MASKVRAIGQNQFLNDYFKLQKGTTVVDALNVYFIICYFTIY